ncbi:MAG: ROK family transcriptional regulator [Deinococcales bacterium]
MNTAIIRQLNVSRVFHALREHPGSSQREIVRLTGLDRATVSTVVAQLEEQDLLERTPRPSRGRAGRPEKALRLSEKAGWFVGVRLDPQELHVVATTIDARVVAIRRAPGSSDVNAAVGRVGAMVRELAAGEGVALEKIRGVGVGVPGLMDRDGRLALGPNLGWHDVPILSLLRDELPVPVYADNDTKAAALAETLFGACHSVMDFVLVIAHAGIGSALYQGGMLQRGWHGYAGELGHVKVVPDGRACGCGGHGCLEAYASERAILGRLREAGRSCDDMTAVARLAGAGDPVAIQVLEDAGEKLGTVLATVLNLTNPHRIVVGGGLAQVSEQVLPAVRRVVARDALGPVRDGVEVLVSALGEEAVAMGGVALAMEGFLSLPSWISHGQLRHRTGPFGRGSLERGGSPRATDEDQGSQP